VSVAASVCLVGPSAAVGLDSPLVRLGQECELGGRQFAAGERVRFDRAGRRLGAVCNVSGLWSAPRGLPEVEQGKFFRAQYGNRQEAAVGDSQICRLERLFGAWRGAPAVPVAIHLHDGNILSVSCTWYDESARWQCEDKPDLAGFDIIFEARPGMWSFRKCWIASLYPAEIKTPMASGGVVLQAALDLCSAAGYQYVGLQDEHTFTDQKLPGKALGIFQRGWTWYMRNGFLPVYSSFNFSGAWAGGGGSAVFPEYSRRASMIWCSGEEKAREATVNGKPVRGMSNADVKANAEALKTFFGIQAWHPSVHIALHTWYFLRARELAPKVEGLLLDAGCRLHS